MKKKHLLIESFYPVLTKNNIVELPSKRLIESKEGKTFENRIVLKDVPITRYVENSNGRIYPKELWENVYSKNVFDGSYCFADHKDEPSVKDIVGVWSNLRVLPEYAIADLALVGDGKLMVEIIENGGRVGFSTVGYGEISESDNKTVNPDTYDYVSTDWVVSPSQNVYATEENLHENKQINKNIISNFTNNKDYEKNNFKKEVFMDKYIEATLRNQVRATLKEIQKNASGDVVHSIGELQEMLKTIPSELVDVRASIENTIVDLNRKLQEKSENQEKQLKEKEKQYKEKVEELSRKLEKANKIVNHIAIYKQNIREMHKDIKQFVKDRILMEQDIKIFLNEIKKRDADIECFIKERVQLKTDVMSLKESQRRLKNNINKLNKMLFDSKRVIKKLIKVIKENDIDIDDEIFNANDNQIIDTVYDNDVIDDVVVDDVTDVVDDVDIDDVVDDIDTVDDVYVDDEEEFFTEEEKDDKKDDENKDSDEEDEEEDEEDEKDEKDEDEDEEEDDEEDKKKSERKMRKNKAVLKYYKESIKEKPYLRAIKHRILSSKSLFEAIKVAKNYENNLNKSKKAEFKLTEKDNNSKIHFGNQLINYKFTVD